MPILIAQQMLSLMTPYCYSSGRSCCNIAAFGMALSREKTKVLFVASLCAVGVIFIVPKTPVLPRHHGWKENDGKQQATRTSYLGIRR